MTYVAKPRLDYSTKKRLYLNRGETGFQSEGLLLGWSFYTMEKLVYLTVRLEGLEPPTF